MGIIDINDIEVKQNDRQDSPYLEYAIVPLDLPVAPIPLPEIRAFVQRYCEQCKFKQNKIRYVAFYARKPILDGKLAVHVSDQVSSRITSSTHFDWDPLFKRHFPEYISWCEKLPFVKLSSMTFITQTDDIPAHLDCFGYHNSYSYFEIYRETEPSAYRILFIDPERPKLKQCFYACKEFSGERHYVRLPPGTNTIGMSLSTIYHGSKFNEGEFKTTGVIHGVLDKKRHLELIARSVEKYAGYAIKASPTPVEGPGAVLPYTED